MMGNVFTGSDTDVLKELGRRVERLRLDRNWTQEQLARESGVSRPTVERMEAGSSGSMTSFIRVLRALDRLEALDDLVPVPDIRPMDVLRAGTRRRRQRARPRTSDGDGHNPSAWTWGDEV